MPRILSRVLARVSRPMLPVFLLLLCAGTSPAQSAIELPRQSQAASVSQTFGYTTATVAYSRPAVNGRVIWGGLVPYGRVWRAGANEPTTIAFDRDVTINGKPLVAGTYALFVLPEQKAWTFIFSRNTKGWGAFGYNDKDDALRVTVKPEKAPHRERMEFAFRDIRDSGAALVLHWEQLAGTLAVTAEFLETAKASIAKGISNIKAGDPYAWLNAAKFYRTYNVDRKQAMGWVEKSIEIRPMFGNLWVKAEWLAEDKRYAEALETGRKARDAAAGDPGLASQLPSIDKTLKEWETKSR